MKKLMKKLSVLLVCVLAVGLLSGCGNSFDASAYVKALLDNSYKNDSKEFVSQKIGTAEEAAEFYEQGIDLEIESLTEGVNLSDDLVEGYRDTIENIYANVQYTVGDAEKQSDGSYVVTIEYQQMQIYEEVMASYETKGQSYMDELYAAYEDGGEFPSDDEIYEHLFSLLKDCLDESLESATYGDTQRLTIRVELIDNVYTPNDSDLANLEYSLLDLFELQ